MLKSLTAVSMCDGLKFVKILKIERLCGRYTPFKGRFVREILALFDHLITRLQDHSLLEFKWCPDNPPLDSQVTYIWEHQWNIQSFDLYSLNYSDQLDQWWKDLMFPQKYIDITLPAPLKADFLAKFDLSCMRSLTVMAIPLRNDVSSCIQPTWVL